LHERRNASAGNERSACALHEGAWPHHRPTLPRVLYRRDERRVVWLARFAQALAKIERGYERDLSDVREMFASELITSRRLLELFEAIAPLLYRYPAISPAAFRQAVEQTVTEAQARGM
jgi:hypothetical protein